LRRNQLNLFSFIGKRGILSKNIFKANNWFATDANKSANIQKSDGVQNRNINSIVMSPAFENIDISTLKESNSVNKYFIPGWTGESLISKEVKKFLEILNNIHADVEYEFLNSQNLSNKIKSGIFDEFLAFAEHRSINFTEIDDQNKLWLEIRNEKSPYRVSLDQFIKIYTFRIAVIYSLKIRFISVLLDKTNMEFDLNKIAYPNSFLTLLFKRGSSKELKSSAIEQNIFSWYIPSSKVKADLQSLYEVSIKLSITEVIKNISIQSEKILNHNTLYSHALSHKNFGLFINSLLINFPLWLNNFNHRFNNPFRLPKDGMEVISCKFDGDYLESLSLSHWLAQENNKEVKWDQILCPDFKGTDFKTGLYMEVVNELQFLTFLAQIANDQGRETAQFISKVMSGHLHNRKSSNSTQKNMLFNDLSSNSSTYDRVILNITDYPKSNVQHFLINKINAQTENLKEDGLIYLISSKKLFVASQKTRIESLLKRYKLEGYFDLEELKGKGEVGSHLYIFSKAKHFERMNNKNSKQSCFNFRLNGQLDTFQHFNILTKLIQDFFISNLNDVPSMYHKEMKGFELEFFQDAIVDGRLIHSSSKDSSQITHPQFFNGLMKSCRTFDFYFDIQNVDLDNSSEDVDPILAFTNIGSRDHAPYIAIVDGRAKDNSVKIEIINSQALEAKAYEYGHSVCHYFQITPKWPNMNLDAVRDFFATTIGRQIVDLTFNNEARKAKANLSKLLLPKIFISNEEMPEHIAAGMKLLKLNDKEILSMHPHQIEKDFLTLERMLGDLAKHYPMSVTGGLATFRRNLIKCIDMFGISKTKSVLNFSNPILKTPLLLSKTYPIYPTNEDIFLEFHNTAQRIHVALAKVISRSEEIDGIHRNFLELYSQNELILTVDSDREMIQFLEFILNNCIGRPISQILQGIEVPRLEDLKNILQSFNAMKRIIVQTSDKITPLLERVLTQSITKS
jgi:hypothetical protein